MLFFISYRVVKYRRALVRKNLKNSFPEKSEQEIISLGKEFYRRLCDHAVETLKLLTISKKELRQRMKFQNEDFIQQYKEKNQPFFYFSSHQFNWEWLLGAFSAKSNIPIRFVYQSQQNQFFDKLLLQARTHFGARGITRERVSKEVIKQKRVMRAVSIVADQFPGHGNDKKHWTKFLNQDTAFFQGVGQLACKLGYPIIFTSICRIKKGYYACKFIKIAEPPYNENSKEIIDRYAKEIEKMIKSDISGWLWSHNRWKKR